MPLGPGDADAACRVGRSAFFVPLRVVWAAGGGHRSCSLSPLFPVSLLSEQGRVYLHGQGVTGPVTSTPPTAAHLPVQHEGPGEPLISAGSEPLPVTV